MTIEIPTSCKQCRYIGDYTEYPYSRSPHYCCELIWALIHDDYKVNPDIIDENCPLKDPNMLKAIETCANKLGIDSVDLVTEDDD